MRFAQLTDTAYSRFAERQERMSFAQLPAYAATRRDQGAEVSLVGVVDGDPERILAAAIVSYQPWKRVFKRANIVFGPTFEEYSPEVERVFYEGLLDFVKRDKSVLSVRVTPATIRRHYDDITPGDETAQAQNLDRLIEDLGGHRVMLDFSERPDIPVRFSYVKNIEGMDFAAVQKSTGQQVRTAFNRKGTNGVEVKFASPEEVHILDAVLEHTAERTDMAEISSSRISYYASLAKNLGKDKAFSPSRSCMRKSISTRSMRSELKSMTSSRTSPSERPISRLRVRCWARSSATRSRSSNRALRFLPNARRKRWRFRPSMETRSSSPHHCSSLHRTS